MIDPKELAEVLDSILEGMQVLSPDWRYLHVNDVAAAHGRSSKAALIGRTILECYPGIDETPVFAAMHRCMTERVSQVLENEFTFPDGSKGHFELRIAPVPQGICVLSIDVTARREAEAGRRRAEERLAQAQRMEAIGLLAAGIAHDFSNLLTVILGQGEIALSREAGPQAEDVETVVAAARSATGLTRQLLAYARRTVLTTEVVDLTQLLRQWQPMLRRAVDRRIDLVLDLAQPVAPVDADRTQLERLVMNLVLNARDAIADTGRITVALASVDFDSDYVLAHPDSHPGPHTVLIVRDTGCGMDAATQARMFEPFFTTKNHGTGLGLASVYGIVRQHRGNVQVHSAPGSGTTVSIHLPCARGVANAVVAVPRAAPSKTPATILVVDDRPELTHLMRLMLATDAHRVLTATGGEAALDLWRQYRPGIDLLITDSRMPGMNGNELIRRLRADAPELPVLCTSAHTEADLAQTGELLTTVSFLEKPFTRTQLRGIVSHILQRGRSGA